MKIETLTKDAADTLRELDICKTIDVIEEDVGDVVTKLQAAIAKTSLCVVVGWDGFTPKIGGPTSPRERPLGKASVVVSVFENPITNRVNQASPRLLAIAQAAAVALDGAASEGMSDTLHLKVITKVQELNKTTITCDVVFETEVNL